MWVRLTETGKQKKQTVNGEVAATVAFCSPLQGEVSADGTSRPNPLAT